MDENKEIDWYFNTEDHDSIICPYCGQVYKPSLYGYAHIGSEQVDCYIDDDRECTCDVCGKKFKMNGYQVGWRYHTETIDGEATEEEVEEGNWIQ